ncbi:hypothetical protein AC06_0275 [Escherichia coli 3-373-03_S3_C1]|nr:hypothetical protein AC06_0275 [Escherichia coli 3-373-03_S3_C1]
MFTSACCALCDGTVCTWIYADFMLLSVSLYTLVKNIGQAGW